MRVSMGCFEGGVSSWSCAFASCRQERLSVIPCVCATALGLGLRARKPCVGHGRGVSESFLPTDGSSTSPPCPLGCPAGSIRATDCCPEAPCTATLCDPAPVSPGALGPCWAQGRPGRSALQPAALAGACRTPSGAVPGPAACTSLPWPWRGVPTQEDTRDCPREAVLADGPGGWAVFSSSRVHTGPTGASKDELTAAPRGVSWATACPTSCCPRDGCQPVI